MSEQTVLVVGCRGGIPFVITEGDGEPAKWSTLQQAREWVIDVVHRQDFHVLLARADTVYAVDAEQGEILEIR